MISLSLSWPVTCDLNSSPTHPVEEGEWEISWVRIRQSAKVKPTTAGIGLYKQLQPCPDHFKHMNSTIEFIVGFIQVCKGIRICPLMILLDLHRYQIPWACAQQSSKSVALCNSQYKMLIHKNTSLIWYNCEPIPLYETIEIMWTDFNASIFCMQRWEKYVWRKILQQGFSIYS